MFRFFFLFILIINCIICSAYAQNSYSLNSTRESIIFTGGISLGITDLLLINDTKPISVEELNSLSIDNINSFDRATALNFSSSAGSWSDALLYTTILSPLLLTTSSKAQNNIGPYLTMYLQNTLTAFSISHLSKATTGRFRPYTYNEQAPGEKRMAADSRLSFFSGHATLAFASAVFLSVTFSKYHPDSKLKPVVWGTSLIAASLVGYLRYSAGSHFPTDIIAGAVVGSVIGFLFPLIHEDDDTEMNSPLNKPTDNVFSITIQF